MPKSSLTLAEKESGKKTASLPIREMIGQISWLESNFLLVRGFTNAVIKHVVSSKATRDVQKTSIGTVDKTIDLFSQFNFLNNKGDVFTKRCFQKL